MNTQIIPANSNLAIQQVLKVLRAGGLVAFPTDTVYGLGALAFNGKAVEAIYIAKDRPAEKAIPILLGDLGDLPKVTSSLPPMAAKLASRFWPGPLTLIVPKNLNLPEAVSATATVAVRVPNHEIARAILRAAGPMAVTSANISGQPSPVTADEVFAQLGGRIELIINGGKTPGGKPSTLVDCTGNEPAILRDGPISMKELLSVLQ
jgi:L-threonylcarbamoyladenylate synthase